jgi:hypothetical protein
MERPRYRRILGSVLDLQRPTESIVCIFFYLSASWTALPTIGSPSVVAVGEASGEYSIVLSHFLIVFDESHT